MSSTVAEPPPGVPPGGQAGDPNNGPQTSARSSSQQAPHSEHSDGKDAGGDDTCGGRLDLRPPVPGEEDIQRSSHHHHLHHHGEWGKEPPGLIHQSYSDWDKEHLGGSHLLSSMDWSKVPPADWGPKHPFMAQASHHLCSHYQGDAGGDGPAVSGGSVEGGSPCFGGGEGGSTPPAVRWSESLLHLLEDSQGVQLFQDFLKEECGSCESLHFWFACNGLRKSDKQDPSQLVTIIWKRFIRNFVVRVSDKTYQIVNDRINARSIDRGIFDDAQREVEDEIARSTYPSFLKSERYLTYLAAAAQHTGGDSPHTPSPCSPGAGAIGGSGVLPTLHEDYEYEGNLGNNTQLRLTQGALAATVKQRAAAERRKPEAFAGQYLHGVNNCGGGGGRVNPYHAFYATAHVSSRQDSELQSLSSDALTDDTHSCTDSSVDGMSVGLGGCINPKHQKRHYYKMRENARQNRELALSAATGGGFSGGQGGGVLHGGVPFMPRTHRLRHDSIPSMKPREFAALLIERLDKVKRDRESQEKVHQSFKKIQEGDNVSDECRREHAFNSLPPSLLLDKLAQKIPLDEADPSQSILDEHVSRVWQDSNNDTPARSPGSPRPKSPSGRRSAALQPSRPSVLPHLGPKGNVGHPSMYVSGTNYLPPTQASHHPHHVSAGHRAHYPPGHPAHLPPGHIPNPYQANKSWHHPRRRDRGQDVYSTFSSDSGNVADYNESTDRSGLHPLPKSRSMPEYMENYAGTSSDGGSSGRRQPSNRRSNSRRAPADLTDSGVSVVSDSRPSLTPSASSTDRRSSSGGGRRSVSGGSVGGGGGLSASSMSGSGSLGGSGSLIGGRLGSVERGGSAWISTSNMDQREMLAMQLGHLHLHATHPSHGSHSSHLVHDDSKRRSRGGGHGSSRCASHNSGHNWSHSEGSSGRGSCHGDSATVPTTSAASLPSGPGSNGSTLRKQRPSRHSQPTPPGTVYESGGSSSGGSGGGGSVSGVGGGAANSASGGAGAASSGSSESTTIVYNFHDDAVPFVTRVPTRQVTLRRFKQHLPKKGNYRFFFKKQCEELGVIQEEITEDSKILPLFEGKINAQIRKAD